ncbi:hypothetical protein BRC81_05695 [Halobacteriales archaeon QS_1_68_20]|nr:MAG: hypothetical protein BRC81_05695 [Halobacteriales archaeon QS_1_68_20]
MVTVPSRDEVPERYRWDLGRLFESPEDWDAEYDAVAGRVETLADRADALAESDLDGEALAAALSLRDELNRRRDVLWLCARLHVLQDTTDEDWRGRLSRYHSLKAEVDEAASAIEPAVQAAGRERVESLVASHDDLAQYDHLLDDVLRRADHTRSPGVERVLSQLQPSVEAPRRFLRTLKNRDFDPPTVETPDGEQRTVTAQTRERLLAHPDRAFRRRVYEAYDEALARNRHAHAQGFVDHLRSHARRAAVRNYDDALAMALGGTLPREVYDALAPTVRENLDPYHRRFDLLADHDGIENVRPWDVQRPLVDGERPEIPYDEAADLILAAVEPLSEAYQRRVRRILEADRVDVYETEHKQTEMKGASFAVPGGGPFVHLNYHDDLESLFLFAHELGHAVHQSLAAEAQPTVYGELPDHLGEIPSYCHETLLVEHLLATRGPAFRAHLVDAWLSHLSLFRAARWLTFVESVYDLLDDGEEPGADRLDDLYGEVEAEFRPVAPDGPARRAWMRQALGRRPFAGYLYVLGISGGIAVARRLREGDLDPDAYRDFLSAGTSEYPVDLLARLDLDFASGDPVQRAVGVYGNFVDELADVDGE